MARCPGQHMFILGDVQSANSCILCYSSNCSANERSTKREKQWRSICGCRCGCYISGRNNCVRCTILCIQKVCIYLYIPIYKFRFVYMEHPFNLKGWGCYGFIRSHNIFFRFMAQWNCFSHNIVFRFMAQWNCFVRDRKKFC